MVLDWRGIVAKRRGGRQSIAGGQCSVGALVESRANAHHQRGCDKSGGACAGEGRRQPLPPPPAVAARAVDCTERPRRSVAALMSVAERAATRRDGRRWTEAQQVLGWPVAAATSTAKPFRFNCRQPRTGTQPMGPSGKVSKLRGRHALEDRRPEQLSRPHCFAQFGA